MQENKHRPIYETGNDLTQEKAVADELSVAWKCKAVKLPKFYHVDWALLRDKKIMAWLEIKCRKNSSSQYPTLILSLHKWSQLRQLQGVSGIKAFLVARFTDGIFFTEVNYTPEITIGGRSDRGDWQDIEPVVNIPIEGMKKI